MRSSVRSRTWSAIVASHLIPAAGAGWAAEAAAPEDANTLAQGFVQPPESARPWVYWFWLNGNITREGITADLESMRRMGIGGVLIMEVDQGAPVGPVGFMSDPWRELFKHVVAEAGRPGMITIATNMAGRGTDIVLGGSIEKQIAAVRDDENIPVADKEARFAVLKAEWQPLHAQVLAAGGLHIIGSERHESRRIDNQLRGRSGRQGDPGSSRFYLALDDPLLKIFAGERLNTIMVRLKMPEGEAIEHPLVSRSLESAQRKVEQRNFDIRKQLLEYDDVSNDQRKVIYQQRNELLDAADIADTIDAMRQGVIHDLFREHVPAESVEEQWNLGALEMALTAELTLKLPVVQWVKDDSKLNDDDILKRILDAADAAYEEKVARVDLAAWRGFERSVMLQSLDTHWREHLAALDHLRQGIHLRGYAQKNPKQEYKREAFELFEALLGTVRQEVTRLLMTVEIRSEAQIEEAEQVHPQVENVQYHHADYDEALATAATAEKKPQPQERAMPKVGRNDPCPCGSGKKYKHCHGKLS